MKDCLSLLPMYLQHSADEMMTSGDKRKVKNNEKFIKNVMGSTMIAMSSASNESKADAMARGKTAAKMWFDELAFLFFNKTILEAALPAFNKASENAEDAGNPYSIMISTTPGDLSAPHGAYAYNFMKNCIPFREQFYDDDYKNDHEKFIKKVKKSTHTNGFIFIQFHYYELGYTDEWYIKNTQALDPIKARREYLLEWINTSGNSPFDEDDVELLIGLARQKEKKEDIIPITKRFDLRVYSYYKGKLPVIISCDVAQGIGKDQNTLVAINPETLEPMALFASNRISSTNFKKFIVKVVQKMYPYCIITIENNSIGTPLINELLETPVGRFIYREKKTRVVDTGVSKFGGKKRQEGMEYGHNVNTVSRPIMMNLLENMVKYSKQKLAIPEIVEEIQRMEWKNGRITHSNASHDDITMAYLGGLYIIKHGVNMRGRGIYFNIAEDNDEKIDFEDIDNDFLLKANRTLRNHNARYYDNGEKNKFDDMIDRLLDGEEVKNPMNIKKRDYDQYRAIQDRIDGFEDEFETMQNSIPRELESKILSGAQRMISNLNNINADDDDYTMEDVFAFNKQRTW